MTRLHGAVRHLRFIVYRLPLTVYSFLFTIICSLFFLSPALLSSQSQATPYWQYEASARLEHIVPADLDGDGIDEFLIVDELGGVTFVNAKGEREWSQAVGLPVTAVGIIPQLLPATSGQTIILGLENELVLLTNYGDEIRRFPLTAVDIPLSLLTSTGSLEAEMWQSQYPAIPRAILPYDYNQDGLLEILVLLHSGQMQLFDQEGSLLWRYTHNTTPSLAATPFVETVDIDPTLSGAEILLGFFTPRGFSQLAFIDNEGNLLNDRIISGQITDLTTITLAGAPHVVLGTSRGELLLFGPNQQRIWRRTLNKPITSIAEAQTPAGPLIIAGTAVGVLVAYDGQGRRAWTQELAPEANYEAQNISTASFIPQESQPLLSVLLRSHEQPEQPADVFLINSDGRILEQFPGTDVGGLTQLVDVNHDQLSELLLAYFAVIELQGLGIGSSSFVSEWEYPFFEPPTAVLTADFTQDGVSEIFVGAEDGRIHRLSDSGDIQWIIAPGNTITHLAQFFSDNSLHPQLVVVRQNVAANEDEQTERTVLELRAANGDKVWAQPINGQVTSLLVTDFNQDGNDDILVGNDQGQILLYDHEATRLWQTKVSGAVRQLLVRENLKTGANELFIVGNRAIKVADPDHAPRTIAIFPVRIQDVYLITEERTNPQATAAVILKDGSFLLLDGEGDLLLAEAIALNGRSLTSSHYLSLPDDPNQSAHNAFLIATDNDTLLNLRIKNSLPEIAWEITGVADVTSIFHGNLDEDTLPEIAVGDREGNITLITEAPDIAEQLNVVSSIHSLDPVNNSSESKSDLLVTTNNGKMQLFSAAENRPPLLTNPQVDIDQEIGNFSVSVQDVERDDVVVKLELFDPQTSIWRSQGEKQVSGSGNLVWRNLTVPLQDDGAIAYRFQFTDGFHKGTITPPKGRPSSPMLPPQTVSRWVGLILVVMGMGILVVIVRQRGAATAQARRFYRKLKQDPQQTLPLLDEKYQQTNGAPDFFVNLANEARLHADFLITNLADSLFLLADRPLAGLSIMGNALDEIGRLKLEWEGLSRWTASSITGQLLLEAPSITELSLLRPQLAELLTLHYTDGRPALLLGELLPILTNLRDSERVEQTDDRLVYLSEANLLTNLLRDQLTHYPPSIDRTLVTAIIKRWSGLLSAEIEEMRGQAELTTTLKTKQLLPIGKTDVILEISNNGRSPAENIMVMLDTNPAYAIHSDPKVISILPPHRTWQITFTIEPKVSDRFRLSLTITYDDRNKRDRELAFGDMVHLMLPSQTFQPIPNPYLPGTPLRQNSTLFYGREELFAFIAENAARLSQRNVLILFGQRRTGKTSIMLRLQQHLPANILPVYIDCQSLGVTRGMPALLSDLAWQVADALALRDIEIDVPETAVWQKEPTVLFQRRFLPEVRQLLPPDTIILLVFDEFEAFENLVRDGLLPSTFFTYMRHLMQHSEGLSFIFVGTHHLEEMTADYWSVLFNIALYEKIGYLNEEAMSRLIREPVEPYLIYDDLALDKIQRVTAGHPYFLQLVCYTLVKRANAQRSTYITISNVNAALDEMMLLGEVHFAYIWRRSSFVEKAMLTAVAHLMEVDMIFHPGDLMQYLETYGIKLTPTEVTTALNSLTQREILAEVSEGVTTLYELKTGLIGLWVAKYQSLSKLHAERDTEAS